MGGEFDVQKGSTALMWAAKESDAECLRQLIDVGADKDAKDKVRRRSLLCRGAFLFDPFRALARSVCVIVSLGLSKYIMPSPCSFSFLSFLSPIISVLSLVSVH